MPTTALGLVLVAALLHASWNIVAKRYGGGPHFACLSALAMVVLWAPLGVALAWGVVPQWGVRTWGALLASGIVHLVYFNILLAGYRAADLTVVYPVARGTGPLLAASGAVVWLGERVTVAGIAGIAAIAVGVLLVAGGPALWRGGDDEHRRRRRLGIAWGTATGLTIALYTLIDGYAVKVLLVAPPDGAGTCDGATSWTRASHTRRWHRRSRPRSRQGSSATPHSARDNKSFALLSREHVRGLGRVAAV